jgi:hypothetical protein
MATKVQREVPAVVQRFYRRFEGWRSSRRADCRFQKRGGQRRFACRTVLRICAVRELPLAPRCGPLKMRLSKKLD